MTLNIHNLLIKNIYITIESEKLTLIAISSIVFRALSALRLHLQDLLFSYLSHLRFSLLCLLLSWCHTHLFQLQS
jgi:hypothetical protein